MKLFYHLLSVVIFSLLILSCSEDSPTESPTIFEGNFFLTQVNGEGLPYLAESTENWEEYLAGGSIEFTQSGRFEWELNWQKIEGGETENTQDDGDGRYSVSGSKITFVPPSDSQFSGSISNGILTVNGGLEDDFTFTFLED